MRTEENRKRNCFFCPWCAWVLHDYSVGLIKCHLADHVMEDFVFNDVEFPFGYTGSKVFLETIKNKTIKKYT